MLLFYCKNKIERHHNQGFLAVNESVNRYNSSNSLFADFQNKILELNQTHDLFYPQKLYVGSFFTQILSPIRSYIYCLRP